MPPTNYFTKANITDKSFMVFPAAFWLNGRLDTKCVSAGNCDPDGNDIQWEDEGPDFDKSLYEGWMGIRVDNSRPCLMVCTAISNKHILL